MVSLQQGGHRESMPAAAAPPSFKQHLARRGCKRNEKSWGAALKQAVLS